MATNFSEHRISKINIGNVEYKLKSVPFHATEAEWLSISYIPSQGEMIVYDVDATHGYLRFKTGDGTSQASALPFSVVSKSEMEIYVNSQIGSAGHLKRVVLEEGAQLPSVEDADIDTIYMKLAYDSKLAPNIYEEYMVINGAWEIIGNTTVDLSDYATIEFVQGQGYLTTETYKGTVEEVGVGTGLKLSGTSTVNPVIDIDEDVIFILNCGDSKTVI